MGRGAYLIAMLKVEPFMAVSMDHTGGGVKRDVGWWGTGARRRTPQPVTVKTRDAPFGVFVKGSVGVATAKQRRLQGDGRSCR
jgi:hypothetical protein